MIHSLKNWSKTSESFKNLVGTLDNIYIENGEDFHHCIDLIVHFLSHAAYINKIEKTA